MCAPNPDQFTLLHLKEEISEKTGIATNEQVLYLNESPLPADDSTVLTSCKGMKNGVAICVTTQHNFIINVLRSDTGAAVKVELPLLEYQDWSIEALKKLILFKFGVPLSRLHVLAIEGIILKDGIEETKNGNKEKLNLVKDYPQLKAGCLVTLTLLSKTKLVKPIRELSPHSSDYTENVSDRTLLLPAGSSDEFVNDKICYSRLSADKNWEFIQWKEFNAITVTGEDNKKFTFGHSSQRNDLCKDSRYSGCIWNSSWTIHIKQSDGTITSVMTEKISVTPVIQFRELVCSKTSIPTYQQRLVFGRSSVLEDWDYNKKRPFMLCDYDIHDGAIYYISVNSLKE